MTKLEKSCMEYMYCLGFWVSYGYKKPRTPRPDGKGFVTGIDCINKKTGERFGADAHPEEISHYLTPADIVPYVRRYVPEAFINI